MLLVWVFFSFLVMYNEEHALASILLGFSCERRFDGSHIKETVRFKPKSRWAESSDLAPFPTLPALYVYFSFIIRFHSHLIPSNLDLLAAAAALKVVLEKGKIIGSKVNTLVEAARC